MKSPKVQIKTIAIRAPNSGRFSILIVSTCGSFRWLTRLLWQATTTHRFMPQRSTIAHCTYMGAAQLSLSLSLSSFATSRLVIKWNERNDLFCTTTQKKVRSSEEQLRRGKRNAKCILKWNAFNVHTHSYVWNILYIYISMYLYIYFFVSFFFGFRLNLHFLNETSIWTIFFRYDWLFRLWDCVLQIEIMWWWECASPSY